MPKFKYLLYLVLLLLLGTYGCSSEFLRMDEISKYHSLTVKENSFILFKKHFTLDDNYNLYEQTHYLLKIGENLNSAPKLLYVYDSKILQLEDFNARIIKEDGSIKSFSKGDLQTYNLSSEEIISESYIKFVPFFKNLSTGDLVEVVYSHKHTLPQLGINFSLKELGAASNNTSVVISVPKNLNLNYITINNFPESIVSESENSKIFTFKIGKYSEITNDYLFEKKNIEPGILASIPVKGKSDFSWKDFGDWYLDMIDYKLKTDSRINSLAKKITKNLSTPKEKMDAIFSYCQKNIRYEQVYINKGEFIPNDFQTIIARKYGDCKDYSAAIYSLGKSIGLNVNLALCHRGRGVEFFKNIPVSQFNHMIVHFSDNGKDYWYDGTNCSLLAGVPSYDLVNQEVLVLHKGKSQLKKIENNKANLINFKGNLKAINKNLTGNLSIELNNQYAINFIYQEARLNKTDMEEYIARWIKANLSGSVILNNIDWKVEQDKFAIKINCEIPNTILIIDKNYLTSLNKIFPQLCPLIKMKIENIFYSPLYNSVNIDIQIKKETGEIFPLKFNYSIYPGPYNEAQKKIFIDNYKHINEKFNNLIKLTQAD